MSILDLPDMRLRAGMLSVCRTLYCHSKEITRTIVIQVGCDAVTDVCKVTVRFCLEGWLRDCQNKHQHPNFRPPHDTCHGQHHPPSRDERPTKILLVLLALGRQRTRVFARPVAVFVHVCKVVLRMPRAEERAQQKHPGKSCV